VRAAEQERPDVAAARREWFERQKSLDASRLVFLDETGTSTKRTRLYGRAARGRRVLGQVPWGHWKTITAVVAIRCDGVTAPFAIDCAMNGVIFLEYLRQVLIPALKPGDIVVMDNLPAHKLEDVRELIEEASAELRYLPPYSPDLNPVEQAIAKLKANLRKAAQRSIEGLYGQIGKALDAITPQECGNFLRNSGYDPT
jgi:transposase